MTINEALNSAAAKLKTKSTSPFLDAEVLLSFVLKQTRAHLFTYPEKILTKTQEKSFTKLVKMRLDHWPVPYLTHSRDFFGLNFYVDKNVLIPRPWTEALVTEAVRTLKNKTGLKLLDVGTGSGAIIISLAKSLGNKNKYFAADISAMALAVAKKNAKLHQVKINFIKSNLINSIKQEFDVVTANLPYLAKETNLSTKHEPKLALISKNQGLKHYQDLFQQLSRWKQHPKFLFIECEPKQVKAMQLLRQKYLPLTELRITKDSSAILK